LNERCGKYNKENMAIISFTLSEEGMTVFHDALACILKFADEVCLEARPDRVSMPSVFTSSRPANHLTVNPVGPEPVQIHIRLHRFRIKQVLLQLQV
jgi:hypothetical protein